MKIKIYSNIKFIQKSIDKEYYWQVNHIWHPLVQKTLSEELADPLEALYTVCDTVRRNLNQFE